MTAVQFDGGGRWLPSAAEDGSMDLRDLARPGLRQTPLRRHDLKIDALRFSPGAGPDHLLSWGRGEPARLRRLPAECAAYIAIFGAPGRLSRTVRRHNTRPVAADDLKLLPTPHRG